MKFWASSEVFKSADPAETLIRKAVVQYLSDALASSGLLELDCMIRYIPIIMPDDLIERYPARSGLKKKNKIYDCAPQLEYDIFVNGTLDAQVREYIQGIVEFVTHLIDLGATLVQVDEFSRILDLAVERIISTLSDHTRH